VAEDEYFIAEDLADTLRRAGATVVGPFAGAAEAIASIEARPPDLAILDINLRGETAFAVADELAARNVPFAFSTGYGANSIPERHAHRPRWQKPADIDLLVATLGG
jgi:DNA-binding response OmpR family regulator